MPYLSNTCIANIRLMLAGIMGEPSLYNQMLFPDTPVCATPSCAAGWGVYVMDPENWITNYDKVISLDDWPYAGAKALGLPADCKLVSLFYSPMFWPSDFSRAYGSWDSTETPKLRAIACRDRWEHFIATDGKE